MSESFSRCSSAAVRIRRTFHTGCLLTADGGWRRAFKTRRHLGWARPQFFFGAGAGAGAGVAGGGVAAAPGAAAGGAAGAGAAGAGAAGAAGAALVSLSGNFSTLALRSNSSW